MLLEGEGPVKIEDYEGQAFRDLIARRRRAGRRPDKPGRPHSTSSTSSVEYRAAPATRPPTLVTVDRPRVIPNYHLMSDTPENLDYSGIEGGVKIAVAVAQALSAAP